MNSIEKSLKAKLVDHGIRKLKLFGFKNVDEENIMMDEVYKLYFEKILRSNMGRSAKIDEAIDQILSTMTTQKKDKDK